MVAPYTQVRAQTEVSLATNDNSAIDLNELSKAGSESIAVPTADDDMSAYQWDATVDSDEEVQEFVKDRNDVEE